ncbi:MAG: hypothetical protein JRG76_13525 [Deltaproteobacteria bacterium]|nr:hypothetical protein [Deltaproteobacteria bacterium]MBW2415520.1 hypothetical protein [Deltaproteobacteria bacterium]
MAKRPADMDVEQWQVERARVWRRRNWVLNGLMLAVIVAIYLRNCV